MRYLIKKAKIVTPQKSSQRKDILIDRGVIKEIATEIVDPKARVIKSKNLHVSIGFCDIGTLIGEPGYEERETIETVILAASHGGYTALAPYPNQSPVTDSKSHVKYIISAFQDSAISIFPIGAVSKNCEGNNISEILDMHQHGAVAFSDGKKSIQNTGVLLRALQYSKAIDSIIIQRPEDHAISEDAPMHEGSVSTSLGLPGNPSESEWIMVKRDIDLANYAETNICLHNISSAEAINYIKKARKKSGNVYASVTSMNLIHTDDRLSEFDPMFKVDPPLRSKSDRKELVKAVNNDIVDYISSNHRPVDLENKDLEFFRSAKGASTLDTVFSSLVTYVGNEISVNKIVEKLAYGSRKIIGLPIPKIEVGEQADLCIFDPTSSWKVNPSNILSKSKNNPYIGDELKVKVLATFNNSKAIIHD